MIWSHGYELSFRGSGRFSWKLRPDIMWNFIFLLFFDQKNWVVGWCFPTHEIKMFKIQKNTFQMLLISSHLDIVGRFSAQMKFEQLSRILKKFRKTEKNWNLGLYTYPFAESSFHFIISYRGRKTMILASFESSRSIFFDSWKRYTHRPVCPADFSWKLRSKKKINFFNIFGIFGYWMLFLVLSNTLYENNFYGNQLQLKNRYRLWKSHDIWMCIRYPTKKKDPPDWCTKMGGVKFPSMS